jgi:hypothetical protein
MSPSSWCLPGLRYPFHSVRMVLTLGNGLPGDDGSKNGELFLEGDGRLVTHRAGADAHDSASQYTPSDGGRLVFPLHM